MLPTTPARIIYDLTSHGWLRPSGRPRTEVERQPSEVPHHNQHCCCRCPPHSTRLIHPEEQGCYALHVTYHATGVLSQASQACFIILKKNQSFLNESKERG